MKVVLAVFVAVLAFSTALPQKEGLMFKDEAIKEAQTRQLIPEGAEVENVQEGIELAVRENIPGDQPINLAEILGGQFPDDVIKDLQDRIDKIV